MQPAGAQGSAREPAAETGNGAAQSATRGCSDRGIRAGCLPEALLGALSFGLRYQLCESGVSGLGGICTPLPIAGRTLEVFARHSELGAGWRRPRRQGSLGLALARLWTGPGDRRFPGRQGG